MAVLVLHSMQAGRGGGRHEHIGTWGAQAGRGAAGHAVQQCVCTYLQACILYNCPGGGGWVDGRPSTRSTSKSLVRGGALCGQCASINVARQAAGRPPCVCVCVLACPCTESRARMTSQACRCVCAG